MIRRAFATLMQRIARKQVTRQPPRRRRPDRLADPDRFARKRGPVDQARTHHIDRIRALRSAATDAE